MNIRKERKKEKKRNEKSNLFWTSTISLQSSGSRKTSWGRNGTSGIALAQCWLEVQPCLNDNRIQLACEVWCLHQTFMAAGILNFFNCPAASFVRLCLAKGKLCVFLLHEYDYHNTIGSSLGSITVLYWMWSRCRNFHRRMSFAKFNFVMRRSRKTKRLAMGCCASTVVSKGLRTHEAAMVATMLWKHQLSITLPDPSLASSPQGGDSLLGDEKRR